MTPPTLATLVYCFRGSSVLLLQRRKPPFVGQWVAPGGKIEPHESPSECALRELHEETGLRADWVSLRALVREVSPSPAWQWLIFVYVAHDVEGELHEHCSEGILRWWNIDDVPLERIPEADRLFWEAVKSPTAPLYEARLVYDEQHRLIEAVELAHPRTPGPTERV